MPIGCLLLLLQLLFELLDFRRDYSLAISLLRMRPEIVLVVSISRIKFLQRNDLRHDGPGELLLRFGFRFFSRRFLSFVAVKNDRTILCSRVMALAV